MTIEEAIKYLQVAQIMLLGKDNQPISDLYFALNTAIASLEAWEKVKEDIISHFKGCSICEFARSDYAEDDVPEYIAVGSIGNVIAIIDKYLQEVST